MRIVQSSFPILGVMLAVAFPVTPAVCAAQPSNAAQASHASQGSSVSRLSHESSWGYEAGNGPDKWAELSGEFETCAVGKNQSPIDVSATFKAELSPLQFMLRDTPLEVLNNGHTIEVEYREGSGFSLDGEMYVLKQFHFHSPSEDRIKGAAFPLEAHLVHSHGSGALAVVSVLFDRGEANPLIDKLWEYMPEQAGSRKGAEGETMNVSALLPPKRDYFRFNGSLTTPPCTEGVLWLIMKTPMSVSLEQVDKFRSVIGENARPVQPLNARVIVE